MEQWPHAGVTTGCLLLPNFHIQAAIFRQPAWQGTPLAVAGSATGSRQVVIDCSPEAADLSVHPGMPVREVTNLCPQVSVIPVDPIHDAAVSAEVLRALSAVVPRIERDGPGCFYIDLRGLARHYSDPAALGAALLQAVPAPFNTQVGLGNAKFVAKAAASDARPGEPRIVAPDQARSFLARRSVDLLPVSSKMKQRLHHLGLSTLVAVTRLSAGAMEAQFSREGRRAWELAHGRDSSPLVPEDVHEPVIERLDLPAPSGQLSVTLIGIHRLVARLLTRPDMRGHGIRKLILRLLIEGGAVWEKRVALKGAIADGQRLVSILRSHLQRAVIDGPVEEIVLEVTETTPVDARQEQLGISRKWQQERITGAIRELTTRYGKSPVYWAVKVEPWSRIPERRWALQPYDSSTSPGM